MRARSSRPVLAGARACRFGLALAVGIGLTHVPADRAAAQLDPAEVTIEPFPVAPGLTMLVGRGGNLAVSTGRDGTLIVDDQFAPLHPKIAAAVAELAPGTVQRVLNTHWHGDHTGGNAAFAAGGATIFAHDAVRARLASGQDNPALGRQIPPAPAAALPTVTFDRNLTLHWNDETIRLEHVPSAHTDGDAIVWFTNANAVHLGDLYFNGSYPFVDVWSGGSSAGVLAALESVLARIDDQTKVIPGHGPLSNRAELVRAHAFLAEIRAGVAERVAAGATLAEILDAKLLASWDATLGGGFLDATRFLSILYADLSGTAVR